MFRWWLTQYSRSIDQTRRALTPHWNSSLGQSSLVRVLHAADKERKGQASVASFKRALSCLPSVFTEPVIDCLCTALSQGHSAVGFVPFLNVRRQCSRSMRNAV